MGPTTAAPVLTVEPDGITYLTSVVADRGRDLLSISGGISANGKLQNADVAAGQDAVQRIWSLAVCTLSDDMNLTIGKIDAAVAVYEKNDKTVAMSTTPPRPKGTIGGRRPV